MIAKQKNLDPLLAWWPVSLAIACLGAWICTAFWMPGAILIGMGVLASPPAFNRILTRLNSKDPLHVRVFLAWIAITLSTVLFFQQQYELEMQIAADRATKSLNARRIAAENAVRKEQERVSALQAEFAASRDQILASIDQAIASNDLTAGTKVIDHFGAAVKDPLYLSAQTKLSEAVSKAKINAEVNELKAKAKGLMAQNYIGAIDVYTRLAELEPNNASHKRMLAAAIKGNEAVKMAAEKARYEAQVKSERKGKIEAQFSGYSGAHRNFERLIKKSMNDPDSYDHVETRYTDKGDYIRIYMTFRGRNAFGGMVMNTEVADYSIDGDFLRYIEQ